MERIYAFTDEAGNNSLKMDEVDVSSHFIVTSIIVEENKLDEVRHAVEEVRKKYFQTGEMKSSSIGKNYKRRNTILQQLMKIDFQIFAVVLDKRLLDPESGLKYKKSFYKFINNLVHKELRASFPILTVCADEIGGNEYMNSFCRYVRQHEEYPDLFHNRDFYFQNSKRDVLVQLADLISGTLLYTYDKHKSKDAPNFIQILNRKIIRIENYPKAIGNYTFNGGALSEEYDEKIANIALKRAQMFLSRNENKEDYEIKLQVQTLKYLCFRFINNDTRSYISTKELRNYLQRVSGTEISIQFFRTRVIAKLRDGNVIIASSAKGLKLPSKEEEVYDFINHGTTIIMPMLDRLKKCRDIIKMDTVGEIDLFDKTEYKELKKFFELEIPMDIKAEEDKNIK